MIHNNPVECVDREAILHHLIYKSMDVNDVVKVKKRIPNRSYYKFHLKLTVLAPKVQNFATYVITIYKSTSVFSFIYPLSHNKMMEH